jgi:DNA-binding CsgD family transcriptional regulator
MMNLMMGGHRRHESLERGRLLPNGHRLTDREIEILRWVARGKSNGAIAVILDRRMNTVKNQLHLIYQKLDVVSRAQAAVVAVRLGVMQHNDLVL